MIQDMKVKDWYNHLINNVTHEEDENGEIVFKQSRIDFLFPHINHENSTNIIRQSGLHSELILSLFLLKNRLLPTKERLKCINLSTTKSCS